MFEQLGELAAELDQLEAGGLPDIQASGDRHASQAAGRRYDELKPVVDAWREWTAAESGRWPRPASCSRARPTTRCANTCGPRSPRRRRSSAALEAKLKELLLPRDPNEGRNVIVEIQGAEGGEEANLWAGDLFRMYQHYAETPRASRSRCSRASRPITAATAT